MSNMQERIGIAVVGCGTVGGATAQILTQDAHILTERVGVTLDLRYIVDLNFDHAKELGLDDSLFCTDLDKALNDKDVQIVVELIGGTTFAKDLTEKALKAGKHVVTANKALLAHHGVELWSLARANGVSIAFEASCAGGIPIIRSLLSGLIANRIDALYGIVNGTCNYILTAMTEKGQTYAEALAQAQADGLAEADPTLDVGGGDSAHKLTILAGLAFGKQINFDDICTTGIDNLDLKDIQYGQELGYVVKLLAIAQQQRGGLSLRVRPAFITRNHPLAWISGPFNAVSVYGHATGHTMYYGRGAGGQPTASAVVADIVDVAIGTMPRYFETLNLWPDKAQPANQLPVAEFKSRYYLRVSVLEQPGVLAKIASILGKYNISICSVLQHETPSEDGDVVVPVIITTYRAREGDVQAALAEIDQMDVINAPTVCISIVDEHPEKLRES